MLMPSNWYSFLKLSTANSPYNALKVYTYQVGSFTIFSRYLVMPQYKILKYQDIYQYHPPLLLIIVALT